MLESDTGTAMLEVPADAGTPPKGVAKRWMLELKLADKTEKAWRKTCERIIKRYRGDERLIVDNKTFRNEFNILWSNTETLAPALYNSTPTPDVRRRFRDSDPIGKAASELLERSLDYAIDAYDFDDVMQDSINDYLLTGRAVVRVRYVPSIKTNPMEGQHADDGEVESYDSLEYEQVLCELVPWEDFRHGPGNRWCDVQWVAFRSHLTRDELVEKFGAIGKTLELEDVDLGDENKDVDDHERDVFKRLPVWEIWSKEDKQVIFITQEYEKPLKIEPDPMGLDGFYPIPRPMYSIRSTKSLIPIPEYILYEDQAKELDRVTARINRLTNALKYRGIYDSTLSEISKLFSEDENSFIPAENVTALIERGGIDKAIWTMPIEMAANVIQTLYTNRDQIKQTIYEITGISDILRGSSNPNETATAQGIKNQWGTLRLQRRQAEVQRFARDILRIKAEIIAEKFQPETILKMTNLKFPTLQEKQQAQMMMQQAQVPPQPGMPPPPPPPPGIEDVLQKPAMEEVFGFLRDNAQRQFRVDIETDSTISSIIQQDQRSITELLQGISGFMQGVAPAVMSGTLPMPAAKALLLSAVRRFKMGSEVEDELDKIPDHPPAPPAPPPDSKPNDSAVKEAQLQGAQNDLNTQKQQMGLQQKDMENKFKEAQLGLREQQLTMKEQAHSVKETSLGEQESTVQSMHEVTLQQVQQMIGQAQEALVNALNQKIQEFMAQTNNINAEANSQVAGEIATMHKDVLTAVGTMAQAMTAPKRIMRDKAGRIIGAETVQ